MKLRVNPILKKELKLGARTFKFPLGISLYAAAFALMSLYILMDGTSWLTNMLYGMRLPIRTAKMLLLFIPAQVVIR